MAFDKLRTWGKIATSIYRVGTNSIDVNQVNSSDTVTIGNFNRIDGNTTVAVGTTIDENGLTVVDATGISDGSYLVIFSAETNRFYVGYVVGTPVGNVMVMDRPFDSAMPIGANVDITTTEMSVDGSTTTQTFGLRGHGVGTPVNTHFTITRILITALTGTVPYLNLFGDLAALTKGIVLRKRDGTFINYFNAKSNQDLAGLMYDWRPLTALNPAQGQDGFISRLTFNGKSKLGAPITLAPGEDLEILLQDDLGNLISLMAVAEGTIGIPNTPNPTPKDALLLESGFELLLENEDYIQLEQSSGG